MSKGIAVLLVALTLINMSVLSYNGFNLSKEVKKIEDTFDEYAENSSTIAEDITGNCYENSSSSVIYDVFYVTSILWGIFVVVVSFYILYVVYRLLSNSIM